MLIKKIYILTLKLRLLDIYGFTYGQITSNLNSNNSQTNYLNMELFHVDDSNEVFHNEDLRTILLLYLTNGS